MNENMLRKAGGAFVWLVGVWSTFTFFTALAPAAPVMSVFIAAITAQILLTIFSAPLYHRGKKDFITVSASVGDWVTNIGGFFFLIQGIQNTQFWSMVNALGLSGYPHPLVILVMASIVSIFVSMGPEYAWRAK